MPVAITEDYVVSILLCPISVVASKPGLLPPPRVHSRYAWEYFRREMAWMVLSRDAFRDLLRMTFSSRGCGYA